MMKTFPHAQQQRSCKTCSCIINVLLHLKPLTQYEERIREISFPPSEVAVTGKSSVNSTTQEGREKITRGSDPLQQAWLNHFHSEVGVALARDVVQFKASFTRSGRRPRKLNSIVFNEAFHTAQTRAIAPSAGDMQHRLPLGWSQAPRPRKGAIQHCFQWVSSH